MLLHIGAGAGLVRVMAPHLLITLG